MLTSSIPNAIGTSSNGSNPCLIARYRNTSATSDHDQVTPIQIHERSLIHKFPHAYLKYIPFVKPPGSVTSLMLPVRLLIQQHHLLQHQCWQWFLLPGQQPGSPSSWPQDDDSVSPACTLCPTVASTLNTFPAAPAVTFIEPATCRLLLSSCCGAAFGAATGAAV